MSIVPHQDHVFIDLGDGTMTEGGLHLPHPAPRVGPAWGTVVAIGPGNPSLYGDYVIRMPPLHVGQRVLVHSGGGTTITLDGRPLRAMRVAELIALDTTGAP